jgi:hypothetical protein
MASGITRRLAQAALVALALAASLVMAGTSRAATITISTTAQLQNALSATCTSSVGPCPASGDTIALTGSSTPYNPTVPLNATVSVTLTGPSGTPGATITGGSITSGNDILDTQSGTTVTIQNLTFTNAPAAGAAVTAFGTLVMTGTTVSGDQGDGVAVESSGTITNSTIAGNGTNAAVDPVGGIGVRIGGPTTLQNDTITGNGDHGVGNVTLGGAPVTLNNTIVYGNGVVSGHMGGDCAMPPTTENHSLDGDGSCSATLFMTNPQLGALGSNGGPTQTEALPAASPAVNAGDNATCPAADQRGQPRNDTHCDVGAFEYQDASAPTISVPPNGIAVNATTLAGATVDFSAQVNGTDPDGDSVTIACNPASGSLFPLGPTTVNCTAMDTHNKSASGSFTVTVTKGGTNCSSADGKVSGRADEVGGSAFAVFAAEFRDDICGSVGGDAGGLMGVVNYDSLTGPDPVTNEDLTLAATSCRTDAFALTDAPYNQAELTALNGAPGALLNTSGHPAECSNFFVNASPPYAPQPQEGPPFFPDPGDTSQPVMTFPVAGTAIALGVELKASDCGGTTPSGLQLTSVMTSRLLGGDIKTWDDASLRAGGLNGWLANCHKPVVRVFRRDSSPTTQNLKNYLVHADLTRSTSTSCFSGHPWSQYANPSLNTTWPDDNGVACSTLVKSDSTGDGAQLSLCAATTGALCYAELPDLVTQSSLIRPALRNPTDTGFANPAVGANANCNFAALVPPGGSSGAAVGLNPTDTWATNNSTNHVDVTWTGSYPVCELTFALVYKGLRTGATAVSQLTFDQRQTLAAFFGYILSTAGQAKLSTSYMARLPSATLDALRTAFAANF